MYDWNVIVTVRDGGYDRARESLSAVGRVGHTDFYNVLVMKTADVPSFLEAVQKLFAEEAGLTGDVSRVVPLTDTFEFATVAQFEEEARRIAMQWLARLAGRSFHVRVHRRGLKEEISTLEEERRLSRALLEALEQAGTPGTVTFEDPDAIVDIETLETRAGMALWTREDLARYPFLHIE
jgi:tRNA(Ser,Leu) C12 N-acetylase TAN1